MKYNVLLSQLLWQRKSVLLRKWHLNCARGLFSHSRLKLLLFLQMTNCSDVVSLLLMQKLLNTRKLWTLFYHQVSEKRGFRRSKRTQIYFTHFWHMKIADFMDPKGPDYTLDILCIFAHCVLVINNILKSICHVDFRIGIITPVLGHFIKILYIFQGLVFQGFHGRLFGQIREFLGCKSQLILVLVWKTISSDSAVVEAMVENLTFQVLCVGVSASNFFSFSSQFSTSQLRGSPLLWPPHEW